MPIGWRVALVIAILLLVIAVHWIERDGLRDGHDGHVSFLDVIYFTMVSITTTGYGDIVPISDGTRTFDALVVTPIRIFFILILAGTAYTFVIKRTWNNWLMQRLQKTLNGHIIVAGFGNSGSKPEKLPYFSVRGKKMSYRRPRFSVTRPMLLRSCT